MCATTATTTIRRRNAHYVSGAYVYLFTCTVFERNLWRWFFFFSFLCQTTKNRLNDLLCVSVVIAFCTVAHGFGCRSLNCHMFFILPLLLCIQRLLNVFYKRTAKIKQQQHKNLNEFFFCLFSDSLMRVFFFYILFSFVLLPFIIHIVR